MFTVRHVIPSNFVVPTQGDGYSEACLPQSIFRGVILILYFEFFFRIPFRFPLITVLNYRHRL